MAFKDGDEIEAGRLQVKMRIYVNQKWWTITALNIKGDTMKLDIEAKFVGRATIIVNTSDLFTATKNTYLGHKHQHVWVNDSSQSREQKDKKMPAVIDGGFGMGSF